MASVAAKIEPVEDIPLERIALDDADGDPQRAVDILTERILAKPELVRENLAEWARAWAHAKVHSLLARSRQTILRSVGGGNFAAALNGAMANDLARMMDMPLYGGKRIADATPAEVRESAQRCASLASDYARKARWQNAVADAAEKKRGTTIGAALTEAALVALWEKSDV